MNGTIALVVVFLISLLLFSTGCSSTKSTLNEQPIRIQELERDEYVVLERVGGEASSFQFKLLFFPFGGKSDQKLYADAYDRAVDQAVDQDADGLLQPRYRYRKTRIPLILFGFTFKKVSAEGRAFRIKSEEEYFDSRVSD